MEKLETIPAWQVEKVKKEVFLKAQRDKKKVHFATLMDICQVFTKQGSSASQMTASKILHVIARLLSCDGRAADAVSAYTQVKLKDGSDCSKFQWPESWSSMEDPVVPL